MYLSSPKEIGIRDARKKDGSKLPRSANSLVPTQEAFAQII